MYLCGLRAQLTLDMQIWGSASSSLVKISVSVPLRCDSAWRNKNLYFLVQVFTCWDLQGMLGVWNPPYPVGRCCPAGQSPRSLLGPGHFYGREEFTGGKGPRILAPVDTPDRVPSVPPGTASRDLVSSATLAQQTLLRAL